MIRNSPPGDEHHSAGDESEDSSDDGGIRTAIAGQGIISQPNERTRLLLKRAITGYDAISDLENQTTPRETLTGRLQAVVLHTKEHANVLITKISNPQSWDKKAIWTYGFYRPISYVPPVILGLLLNILDALSYGEIRI